MVIDSSLSAAFPLGSRVNDLGRLEVGGCDVMELAKEFGTPAYVIDEDDLRARAKAFKQGGAIAAAAGYDFDVVFASKAFPCSAVLSLFAEEGLCCDVASEGEMHLAMSAGFDPRRLVVHGNAKSWGELEYALDVHAGLVVVDNFDEIGRLRALMSGGAAGREESGPPRARGKRPAGEDERLSRSSRAGRPSGGYERAAGRGEGAVTGVRGRRHFEQDDGAIGVLLRVTPDVRGETHEKISTGQANSKFGFGTGEVERAVSELEAIDGVALKGLHAHIGSQLLDVKPLYEVAEVLGRLSPSLKDCEIWDMGGGLGVHYIAGQQAPPTIEEYSRAVVDAVATRKAGAVRPLPLDDEVDEKRSDPTGPRRLLVEPGRSLTANGCVTLYTVEGVKRNASTWVAVDGGMSDNIRPMLYGARYEAHVADRLYGSTECVLAGKHCESGDVIVAEARLDDPKVGDVIAMPATGAYCYAMSSNYNGVLRAPVIFCKDGDARVVVRRERLSDLTARDVAR